MWIASAMRFAETWRFCTFVWSSQKNTLLGYPTFNIEKSRWYISVAVSIGNLFAVFSRSCAMLKRKLCCLRQFIGSASRKFSKFQPDPDIQAMFSAVNKDYWDSGWSRGHMAPAADYKYSQASLCTITSYWIQFCDVYVSSCLVYDSYI